MSERPLGPVVINKWHGGESSATSQWQTEEAQIQIYYPPRHLENKNIIIDINPPLTPGVFKYIPTVDGNSGRPLPSGFDAGVTFDSLDRAIKEYRELGFETNYQIPVKLNYCEDPNEWFDPSDGSINICKGLGAHGDGPPHEAEHKSIYTEFPDMCMAWETPNNCAFHEYSGDIAAATTNRNWKILEGQEATLLGVPRERQMEGLRNLEAAADLVWPLDARSIPFEPHERSLFLTGAIVRVYKTLLAGGRLTDGTPLQPTSDDVYKFIKALVRNQRYFLVYQGDMTPQNFFWSLIGSLNALGGMPILSKLFRTDPSKTAQLVEYLQGLVANECVIKERMIRGIMVVGGFIPPSEIMSGSVGIAGRPGASDLTAFPVDSQSAMLSFVGGSMRVISQRTKLIFEKEGHVVDAQYVDVIGHGFVEYQINSYTRLVTFDRARRLADIDLTVKIDPTTKRLLNYVSPREAVQRVVAELRRGDKLKRAIERHIPFSNPRLEELSGFTRKKRVATRIRLFRETMRVLKTKDWSKVAPRLVLIDSKDPIQNKNPQYEIPFGYFIAYVDIRTGGVDIKPRIFVD